MPRTKKQDQNIKDKLLLPVAARTVFGKKLNKLRKEGVIPANIYGPGYKSQAVTVAFKDFMGAYKTAKETGVVYLKLNSEELPILIKNVQRHPVQDQILHADFRKIDLKQKIQTNVPIKVTGQSEAVAQKNGVLLTLSESLIVEALPTDIPPQIEVDISVLKDIGQEIKVSNLAKSATFDIKDPQDKVIVSVVEHKEESITPETAPTEAPEVITAAPAEEGIPAAEGAKPGEAAAKQPVGKTPETKPGVKSPPGKPAQPAKPAEGKK